MELSEIKNVINAITDDLRAKYNIEWLEYTLNYCDEMKGFYKCDIYMADKDGIKSDYGYIAENTNSEMLKKSFELFVKSVLYEVRV